MKPKELRLNKARPFDGDLRSLPSEPQAEKIKFQHEKVLPNPRPYEGSGQDAMAGEAATQSSIAAVAAAAPGPTMTFDGLGRAGGWGNGYPPDTVGDVGPNHYIQAINTAMAIYDKKTGALLAGPFSFNTLMKQGNFGNLCDTDNFGDPVVLYDTFEDRWVVTDFAFKLDAQGNVVNPPGAFQCFAVSKTGDPVTGGWNFYSIQSTDGLHDYEKLAVWTDGIYMSANMFGFAAGGSFQGVRTWAFNKAQMYAGAPTVQIASFDMGTGDFTLLPSNARLQSGTPAPGTPNHFVSTWNFLNVVQVYKFHVNWDKISLSTFTGPFNQATGESWPNASVAGAPQSGTTQTLDTLPIRAMMQNQYTNIDGVESVWATHTVRRASPTGAAAPRWYQVNITGGTVAANTLQRATWDPDGNNNIHRFVPSLAVDRMGNMAIGYTASGSSLFPSIRYAGRLATDPANTFSQTEQTLFAGTGSQTNTNRWGDYSAMTLDPDGCTFWYTTEYYATSGSSYRTRIGAFSFSQCTPVGDGSLEGTVMSGGNPLAGATVALGSRTTTTDANGFYTFANLPAGTYPSATASRAGYTSSSVNSIVVSESATTTQNFSLDAASPSGCLVDTTQSDFQNGVPTNVNLTASPGNVTLVRPVVIDQQTTNYTTSGVGFSGTSFGGQTFTPNSTGTLQKLDVNIFCASCSGTNPNLIVEVRSTSAGNIVMTAGGLLASSTIAGTSSGSGGFMTFAFATPPTLTAGTQYGFVVRSATTRTTGTQAFVVSNGDGLANGRRQVCSSASCSNASGQTNDIVFVGHLLGGYSASGNLISGAKDANPAPGSISTWGTLSWTNAALPAGTSIQFQAAASNNPAGPFNFVGPNGTASTFFANGASLAQFDALRYLKYRANLSTTNSANTPTLNDVSICFANGVLVSTTLAVDATGGTFGGTVNLSATLTDGSNGISGKSVAFTLNGASKGSATTDANGVATLSNVSLAGINAGSYPAGVGASFAASSLLSGSRGTAALTVEPAGQTITFGALPNKTYGNPPFTVSATGGASGNPVTFAAAGNCTSSGLNGSTITITGAGSCTVTASQGGNANHSPAASVEQTFSIAKATPTVTWNNPANIVYGTALGGTQLNATASVAGGFAYTPAAGTVLHVGNGQTLHVDFTPADADNYNNVSKATLTVRADNKSRPYGAANPPLTYTVEGFANGDTQAGATSGEPSLNTAANGTSAPGGYPIVAAIGGLSSADYGFSFVNGTLTVTKADQTITFGALADKTYGAPSFQLGAGASSGLAVSYAAAGGCSVSGSTVSITGAGSCTITASQAGNTNYNPAANVEQTFSIAKADQAINVGANAPASAAYNTQFTVAATAGSGQAVTYGSSGSCTNAGATFTMNSGLGACTVTYNQAGNDNYNAAPQVTQTVNAAKANQTIAFASPGNKTYGDSDFTVSANASSGLGVSFAATGNCTVSGNTVSITGAGSCTITAAQAGDDNYSGATKSVSFNVAQRVATITADPKAKQFSDPLPTFTATTAGVLPGDVLGGSVTFTTTANVLSPAGNYVITPGGSGFNSNYLVNFVNGTLAVTQEDATLTYTGDTLVTASGNNSGTLALAATVVEAQDGSLGNALGGKMVRFSIYKSTNLDMTTPDYAATGTIGANNIATTTIALPADEYTIKLELMSNPHYTAPVELAAAAVVEPGTGRTVGGGWLTDPNGSRASFAFTVRYVPSGAPRGNSLYIYRDQLNLSAYGAPSGVREYDIVIKSNSMSALTLSNTTTPLTATFTGKNNVIAIDRITGASYNIAGGLGLQFQVDVTDNGEPGSNDTYALRVWNATGTYRAVGTYTASGANTSQAILGGGNIQVK